MKIPFRKLVLYISILVLPFAFGSCGKEDVGPQAGIMADKYQAEPGELITFTSTSTNLRDYAWELDNGVKSDEKTVKTTFDTPGEHLIKLKVTSKGGKTSEASVRIFVGKFYITAVGLNTLAFKDSSGNAWDADGSGPDLYLGLSTPGATSYGWLIGDNITQKNIPHKSSGVASDPLINKEYTMALLEGPEQGKAGTTRVMKSWQFNPILEAQKLANNSNTGIITLPGQYPQVYMEYVIQ